jgi:hypothetical protein
MMAAVTWRSKTDFENSAFLARLFLCPGSVASTIGSGLTLYRGRLVIGRNIEAELTRSVGRVSSI